MLSFKMEENNLLVASMSFSVKLLHRVAKNARKRQLSCLEVGVVESSVVFSEPEISVSIMQCVSQIFKNGPGGEGGKGCWSPTESKRSRRASDRQKLWLVDPLGLERPKGSRKVPKRVLKKP